MGLGWLGFDDEIDGWLFGVGVEVRSWIGNGGWRIEREDVNVNVDEDEGRVSRIETGQDVAR